MKAIIITGSPRKGKNSEKIADRCEELFTEENIDVTKIYLSEKKIGPCIHCDYCQNNYGCSQKDDMNELYKVIESGDALIMITPVYMGDMTAQLKAFIDRSVSLRRNGFLLKGKIGAAISVGGSKNGGQELTLKQIHNSMLIHGMMIVGDNNHFGGTVHAPLEDDDFGKKTVDDTILSVIDVLKKRR